MWRLPTIATALVLSASLFIPAIAQDTSDTTDKPMTGMMGGNCPMMMMMGRAMMGGGMKEHGMGGGGMRHHQMMHGGGGMGMGMMGGGSGRLASIVEARLAYLKSELNITDQQDDAWTAYADAARSRVKAMQGMHQAMVKIMHSGNAVERMEARIQGMEAMLASMKELKPATEKLYAELSDDQKKIADQLIGVGCGAV